MEVSKTNFLTIEEHRQIELKAQKLGLDLMDLAAETIVAYVEQLSFLKKKTVLILVGKGNNGGDGISCAIKLKKLGYCVTILLMFDKLSQNTARILENYREMKGQVLTKLPSDLSLFELIIDAVIGIGISSELDNNVCKIFNKINSLDKFILAIDTPSGVNPFTGKVYPGSIKANTTLTFIADKPGLYSDTAVNYVGNVIVKPLIDFNSIGN